MKMRKLFAGLAAAATLLGGLAIGTTTANAAENDASFTVNAGADFTFEDNQLHAYYIGAYSNPQFGADDKATNVDVTAATDAVKTAAAASTDITDFGGYPDAVAYFAAGNGTAAQLKAFADALANKTGQLGTVVNPTLDTDKKVSTFSNVQQGWYLVTDASGSALLVGTKIWNKDADNGSGAFVDFANQELGTANAKPSSVPTPGKTANKDSVTVGDQVKYTLTGNIPNYTGYDTYDYNFVDTPSDKLAIDANSVTVKIDGQAVASSDDQSTGVKVTYPADNNTKLTIAINAAKFVIGADIEITYTATVKGDAEGDIVNRAVIEHDNNESGTPGSHTVKTTPVQFKKIGVDEDANGLAGVKFTITPKDDNKTPALPTGYTATVTSGADGTVKFAGLANGTYIITESSYADNFKGGYLKTPLSFEVTVNDGNVKFTKDLLGLVTPGTGDTVTTVLNVKNISQLPQTGAAGIALFTVIAALLAGAAATVYGKSRKASAALRA
ncbi:isopeptide-forming domain-containing fimbrial protein [Bifidobacterium avesanii]|uniref:Isopeptide-forming domain-containing fimbrial protein n=1 Tax=Bifidobacterium avesanii TaxID=1798157 RepID=A0A7K3THJ2_9BIFI|nr:isopeptide-forming domain-containing fimbrial protein [Bifidobacterium avesanii]KAB8294580.1 Gram-positive pilin backbone subunit 2, Cna-B-like domain-containing protein [Bifidobacterium avesanii]NEG78090.1 isopeptide-forming domain-containing fimbrial protein [Bifidobacterium avesanii]